MSRFSVLIWVFVAIFPALFVAGPALATEFSVSHRHFLMKTQISAYRDAVSSKDIANVIYLHGYADTFRNHTQLFSELRASGMRVISFDYPSHGQSAGAIAAWDMYEVAEIIRTVLESPELASGVDRFDSSLPLILMGWSTGATMAIRIAQDWAQIVPVPVTGVVAFAPGIPVNPLVMAPKASTLTRNPGAVLFDPKPATTLAAVRFAADLLDQSTRIWLGFTSDLTVPTLVLVGDNQADQYVYSSKAADWVVSMQKKGLPVYGYQCPGAYHGLEFEPNDIGRATRRLAASFASAFALADADVLDMDPSECPKIQK